MVKLKRKNNAIVANSLILQILKGVIISTTISLMLILLFAVFIRFININEKLILPINQIIKILSLFIGCLFALRKSNKGFIKGLLIGVFYALFSYLIFSFLSGVMNFSLTSITDILFCGIIGGICGVFVVNVIK